MEQKTAARRENPGATLPEGMRLEDTVVLLVEDDEAIADCIAMLLEPEVAALRLADSLLQARRLLRCSPPDIIVLDRSLPDGDGAELCAELRAKPETRDIPVLFLSGHSAAGDRINGLNAGADGYLGKPFHPLELLTHLKALLRRVPRTA